MEDGTYKMADFGTSRELLGFKENVTLAGTPNYFAPEVK